MALKIVGSFGEFDGALRQGDRIVELFGRGKHFRTSGSDGENGEDVFGLGEMIAGPQMCLVLATAVKVEEIMRRVNDVFER